MKKITKICVLMATFIAAIAMTGCNFGKDDFFGYWRTTDFVNGERIDYYQTSNGVYQIEWDFNGTSENAFSDGGTFKQHLRRAANADNLHNGVLTNETFWTGKYQLKGNSGYSAGSLVLYYEYGVQLMTNGIKPAISTYNYNDVKDFSEADFLNIWKYGTKEPTEETTGTALLADSELYGTRAQIIGSDGSSGVFDNGVYIQTRYKEGTTDKEYGDIEYFRYRLEDGTIGGYARMLTTTVGKDGTKVIGGLYNQWNNANKTATEEDSKLGSHSNKYGWKNSSECSWAGTNFRALGLVKKDGETWASNDNRTNAKLFKITTNDTGSKITSIDTKGDSDSTTDEVYSDIDR